MDARPGLTQPKLAAYIGATSSAVNRWFHGSIPNTATCAELARVFHLPLEDVLRAAGHLPPGDAPLGAVPPSSLDPEVEAIARALAAKPERLHAWLAAGRAIANMPETAD